MKVLCDYELACVSAGNALDTTTGSFVSESSSGGSSYSMGQLANDAGCFGTVIGSGIAMVAAVTTPMVLAVALGSAGAILGACANSGTYWLG